MQNKKTYQFSNLKAITTQWIIDSMININMYIDMYINIYVRNKY